MGRKARKKNPNYFFLDDDQIPPFDDFDALYDIFAPDVFFEVLEEAAPPDEPKIKSPPDPNLKSPAFEKRILQLAENGRTDEVITLVRKKLEPRKVGRPRMTDAERWRRSTPNHQAALIYEQAKDILEDVYPQQPIVKINERALMVAEKVWNAAAARGRKVNKDTLRTHIARSKQGRRRTKRR